MNYVCHKVGLIFPYCKHCKTYKECLAEADKQPQPQPQEIQVPQ